MKKRVAIVGKFSRELHECRNAVMAANHFRIVTKKPDVVISFGGDGTLLKAEAQYPSIPKLALRKAQEYGIRKTHSVHQLLTALANDELYPIPYLKLSCTVKRKRRALTRLNALNEISIRNKHLGCALRYQLSINHKPANMKIKQELGNRLGRERENCIIGDGIVVATPFGSTGYYSSITRKGFTKGIGIAHNNPTKEIPHRVASEQSHIRIHVLREKGQLCADNRPSMHTIIPGDTMTITKAKKNAIILQYKKKQSRANLFFFV